MNNQIVFGLLIILIGIIIAVTGIEKPKEKETIFIGGTAVETDKKPGAKINWKNNVIILKDEPIEPKNWPVYPEPPAVQIYNLGEIPPTAPTEPKPQTQPHPDSSGDKT